MDHFKLEKISNDLKKLVVEVSYYAGAHHIGSAFSCIDILTILYFHTMNIDPEVPSDQDRDWFILSKGHAALAQYVTLAKRGFFKKEVLFNEFLVDGGRLGGHPDRLCVPGVEMSSGSLGHGLSIGAGIALAAKKDNRPCRAFILLGDGECNEGMIWEAAMFASHQKLDNLIAVVDYNRLQGFGTTDKTMSLDPLKDKFVSFGWAVKEINGHSMNQIIEAMDNLPFEADKPNAIIANTVKGKGMPLFENKLESHYITLNEKMYKKIMKELSK